MDRGGMGLAGSRTNGKAYRVRIDTAFFAVFPRFASCHLPMVLILMHSLRTTTES